MTLLPQFLASLLRLERDGTSTALNRAAIATVETLPEVAGAAICLCADPTDRYVIGVSDDESLLAEQLEYTAGTGPGWHSRETWTPIVSADGDHRWPAFNDALLAQTRFRAIRALPIRGPNESPSCLVLLYYESVGAAESASDQDTQDIADVLSYAVTQSTIALQKEAFVRGDPTHDPTGRGSAIAQRFNVDVAVGMLMGGRGWSRPNALALLRAVAFSHDETAESTGRRLVVGEIGLDLNF
jgi:hypothetical protein